MRLVLLAIVLAGCRPAATARPPVSASCDPQVIGNVIVEGGAPADVPQLAVLAGTRDDRERVERVRSAAIEVLHARGYARAQIGLSRRAGCGTELVVSVTRGPKFTLAAIGFVTNDALPARERYAAIEDGLGSINTIGGAYVEDRMVRGLAELQRRYREAGWLDAVVDPPVPVFDDGRGEVTVTITVRAGERFKFGTVVARGGRRTTRAAVIEALGLRGGQWFDAGALRAGLVRVRRSVDERVEMRVEVAHGRRAIDVEAVVEDPQ